MAEMVKTPLRMTARDGRLTVVDGSAGGVDTIPIASTIASLKRTTLVCRPRLCSRTLRL